jgi:hypothetical protein
VSGRLHSHQTTTGGAAIVICTMLTDASTLSKYFSLSLDRGGAHTTAGYTCRTFIGGATSLLKLHAGATLKFFTEVHHLKT